MDPHAEDIQRAAEIIRRSQELMGEVGEMNERLNEARAAREQRGEAAWQQPPLTRTASPAPRAPDAASVDPVHPVRRPASAARDWTSEAAWVREIANQQIAAFKREVVDGLGRVIAGERAGVDKLAAAIGDDVRALAKRIEGLERREKVLQDEDDMARGIKRLEHTLERLEAMSNRFRRVADPDDDRPTIEILPPKPH